MDCSHNDSFWRWEPHGHKCTPAYAVFCDGCNKLLFTVLFDGKNTHISVPKFYTIAFQDKIVKMFIEDKKNGEVILKP